MKSAAKGCPKLYDTLSSFANRSGGGIIIFGIDENKDYDVTGIYDADDLQKQVKNQCNDMMPKIRASFNLMKWDNNKYVLLVEIPEVMQEEKPCYYSGTGIQKGSYIRVADSDEHMNTYEIYNLTIEELNDVINPPVRNKTLIRILEETDKIENRSSGIATMIMAMRDLRLEPPIFENKRGNFNVVFKNHTLMTKEDREWLNNIKEELSENEAYALIYLRNNDKITNGDYQKINNVNRDKALQELKVLIKKCLIEVNGIGSGSYYKLKDNIKDIYNYDRKSNDRVKEAQDDPKEAQDNKKGIETYIEGKKITLIKQK